MPYRYAESDITLSKISVSKPLNSLEPWNNWCTLLFVTMCAHCTVPFFLKDKYVEVFWTCVQVTDPPDNILK